MESSKISEKPDQKFKGTMDMSKNSSKNELRSPTFENTKKSQFKKNKEDSN